MLKMQRKLNNMSATCQFASTAKKMKNDPHVTEVSDDGALLKRYRNEIVDLKRRLHEASRPPPRTPRTWQITAGSSSTDVCVCVWVRDPLAGVFSHADHSDGEGGPLPAAAGEGSAPEGAGGQNQEPDKAARHQLQPGSCRQGNFDTPRRRGAAGLKVVLKQSALDAEEFVWFFSGRQIPKRRMTWGGKMLRLARQSTAGGGEHPSNQSFAEPFTRKRKADRSCLMTLCEGGGKNTVLKNNFEKAKTD